MCTLVKTTHVLAYSTTHTDYQTTRKNYCSKHDSSISTNKADNELSRRQSRKRGRRPRARRRRADHSPGDREDLALALVLVVEGEGESSRGVVSLDLHFDICVVSCDSQCTPLCARHKAVLLPTAARHCTCSRRPCRVFSRGMTSRRIFSRSCPMTSVSIFSVLRRITKQSLVHTLSRRARASSSPIDPHPHSCRQ